MNKSIWLNENPLGEYQALKKDIKTDVLIIGGGICGLLCGYFLKSLNIDCVIVESNRIASGTSGNTTAKITSLHGALYNNLINKYGIETAKKYFEINEKAIGEFKKIAKNFDCDFKVTDAYTYSLNDKKKIEKEFRALESIGANPKLKFEAPLPFSIAAAVGIENEAEFNPIKFIKYISKDLRIYENTRVNKIENQYAYFKDGKIKAENFIVTTHFPFINKYGLYFLKLYQERSYVLALENAANLDGMYVDEADNGLSFRNYKNLLFLGGGGGRTGMPCGNWEELIKVKEKYYSNSNIKYKWATQDCISLDKIPLIGQYSPKTPNIFVATGFNKWGMTSSMVAAMILSDLISDRKNEYADIFSPSRSILKPQLFINGFEAVKNYIIPTTKRCSHLGCALKWNKYEHSWDCSCHGSRYDNNGNILNNPANTKIK